MSEYVQKRMDYINNWPNGELFQAEKNYNERCELFQTKYGKPPFLPMRIWYCEDDTFNRAISHLIDSLDMIPLHPNFAFMHMFSGLDMYTKHLHPTNTTKNLKYLASNIAKISDRNDNVNDLLKSLLSVVPFNVCQYLYLCLCGRSVHNTNVKMRITTDENCAKLLDRENLVDFIYKKYTDPYIDYNQSIRKPALLYRKIFTSDSIILNESITATSISTEFKLSLLLSGVLYSLRNDSMHGSSMSSTKSSKTTPERYALNYYCYLSTYTIFMILLIDQSTMLTSEKSKKYEELKLITESNTSNFRLLFGNHVK